MWSGGYYILEIDAYRYIYILIIVGSSREVPASKLLVRRGGGGGERRRRAATATATETATATATQGGRAATQRQGQTKGPNDASERANDSFHFQQQWGTKDQVVYHTVVQSPDTCICILWQYSRQVIFTICCVPCLVHDSTLIHACTC